MFTLVDSCKGLNTVQVAAGNEHSLILTDSGDVYSSGYNEMGNSLSTSPNMLNHQASSNARTGHLKLVEKLRGKNIVKIFASNGCEHVIAMTSKLAFFSQHSCRQWESIHLRL